MSEQSPNHMIKVVEAYILEKKKVAVKISVPTSIRHHSMLVRAYNIAIGLIIIPQK